MIWAVLASIAALTPRWLSGGQASGRNSRQTSAEASPTAKNTNNAHSTDVMPLLERRAQRVSNRSRKQAARYMATHKALMNN